MKLTFTDKIKILTTPCKKQYIVFELHGQGRYSMYFTNNPATYPRHHVIDGKIITLSDARLQLESKDELTL